MFTKGKGETTLMIHPFSDGASHLTTTKKLAAHPNSPTFGGPNGLYVTPKSQMDNLLNTSTSREHIEVMLGLDKGSLSGGDLVRVSIDNPFDRNLRIPRPDTGNDYHRPNTGLTTGGLIDSPLKDSSGVSSQIVNFGGE